MAQSMGEAGSTSACPPTAGHRQERGELRPEPRPPETSAALISHGRRAVRKRSGSAFRPAVVIGWVRFPYSERVYSGFMVAWVGGEFQGCGSEAPVSESRFVPSLRQAVGVQRIHRDTAH